MEDPGAESHEEDVVGGSDSGDISIDEGGILPVAYAVENLLVATTESARSSVSLLFQTAELEEPYPIPERSKLRQSVSLVVVVVTLVTLFALVAVLGLTGKFSQGEIPSLTLRLTLRPTPSPTPIPKKCLMQTPPLRLTADDAKDGDWFGRSVSVFEDWAIFGAPFSDEGRAYLYRRVLGAHTEPHTHP